MPIAKYFKGNGDKVMASMRRSNGGDTKAATREFYATANARKMKPAGKKRGGKVGRHAQARPKPSGGFAVTAPNGFCMGGRV